MNKDQQLYAELRELADGVFAGGYTVKEVREECLKLDQRYDIKDAYQRCEAIYWQQYKK